MTEKRDSWWGPVALLMLLLAFSMDLLVWQLSGGTEFSLITERLLLGFCLAFGITSLALLLVTIAAIHQHARWKEQVIGLLLLASLGLSTAHWQMGGSIEDMRNEGAMLFSGMAAMVAAVGLVFGLLLALITGRQHQQDPLLEMESTLGDVEIEIPE